MKKVKLEIGFMPELLGVAALVISLYFVHNLFTATGVMVAMIFTSSVVQKGLNKMGVHVFSQNMHGHYMRMRVKPSNPKSPAQMTSRGSFAHISRSWRGLTDFERGQWNKYAEVNHTSDKLGFKIPISGFHWYMKVNMPLYYMGKEILTNTPAPQLAPNGVKYGEFKAEYDEQTNELTSLKIDYSVVYSTMDYQDEAHMKETVRLQTLSNVAFEIFVSQAESKGKTSWRSSHYRFGTCISRDSLTTGTLDLTDVVNRLVLPAPDKVFKKNIYFKIRQVSVTSGVYNWWDVLCYKS